MAVAVYQGTDASLGELLVLVADSRDAWGMAYSEGYVLQVSPRVRVHRIHVYRELRDDQIPPELSKVLDTSAYAFEWCNAKLNELIRESGAEREMPTVSLNAVPADSALALLFRRWRSEAGELALRRTAIEAASDELKQLIRDVMRIRKLTTDVAEFGPPGV